MFVETLKKIAMITRATKIRFTAQNFSLSLSLFHYSTMFLVVYMLSNARISVDVITVPNIRTWKTKSKMEISCALSK